MLNRLLRLLGLAKWPMRYLMRHPGVIDELADPRLMDGRFDPQAYRQDLEERHRAWEKAGQASEEALLDTLRRAHHGEIFRTLVRDVEGQLTVEQVADDLSSLADVTLEVALRWPGCTCNSAPANKAPGLCGHDPHFAIIAYGKLGGKELGYGSDLDVVFVYDDTLDEPTPNAGPDTPTAIDAYLVFARKLVNWLTLRTSAGELFDIDTALRPQRQLRAAGHFVPCVRRLPTPTRQQHRLDLGTPGPDPRPLVRWRTRSGQPVRNRSACCTVFSTRPAALRDEVVAMRERMRQAHPSGQANSTSSTALAA